MRHPITFRARNAPSVLRAERQKQKTAERQLTCGNLVNVANFEMALWSGATVAKFHAHTVNAWWSCAIAALRGT
ncbi:hypothetical protein KIN20_019573 [Parelaphostrongylus tenuis]|uniref:Uncharacterized protein n=1 Tax=Parelaphostrongylus tenuis TaxID=148309 RepID=A0AAD5N2C5_PARTN|nr:hypothetical protein KIN20_019573 [Parelaphostrongylus tenuis]